VQERFETFTLLIAKINRSIRRIKTEAMSEHRLKSPHVSCLYYLYKQGELTTRELCEVCDEDKSSVSRSLEHLKKCDLVKHKAENGKIYKTQLCLTEKGKVVAKDIHEKINMVLSESSKNVSAEDREVFYRCLKEISRNLEEITAFKQ
jgi:DNA-binding MarR family transcriptional regulator